MKKILKVVLIIILVFLIIFIIHTVRNFIIVKGLQNKIMQYSSSSNFSVKINQKFEPNGTRVLTKYYQKDNKQLAILERTDENNEITKMSEYNNGERIDIFWETKDSKTVQINANGSITVQVFNSLETDNDWQTLLACICAKIRSTNDNGKECYVVTNYMSPNFMIGTETNKVYVEKSTGIAIKLIIDNQITEKEYEFGNVEDSIFVEPDISQYTLKENN